MSFRTSVLFAVKNLGEPRNSCHSEPGAKPGEEAAFQDRAFISLPYPDVTVPCF
jgi:hypothetical protein